MTDESGSSLTFSPFPLLIHVSILSFISLSLLLDLGRENSVDELREGEVEGRSTKHLLMREN